MERRNEKILLAAMALCALSVLVNHLLWTRTTLHSIPSIYPYLTLSAILCGALWARYRFHRLAEEELRDRALTDQTEDHSLFNTGDGDLDPISLERTREQYEKWFMPVLAPMLALLAAYWGQRLFPDARPLDEPVQRLFAAAVLIGQSFALFLFGRYFLGLGRTAENRLLRGPANLLLLAALASALAGVGAIVAELGYPRADRIVRQILAVYLWVLAAEYLINTLVYLYRPKRKMELVVSYESRITALITDPIIWTTNVAQTLDYQFGFRVSETGFYRFARRALLPLILAQLLLLYLLSCLVVLGPEETAIQERFGNPLGDDGEPRILSSGIHLKWPWPFETVRRYPARRILSTHIGYTEDPDDPSPDLILWTRPHFAHEENFIVASREWMMEDEAGDAAVPVNFVAVNMPIEYRITDLYAYTYHHSNTDDLLRMLAYRAVTRELAGRDLIELLGDERRDAGQNLFAELQRAVEERDMGIEILFVGLHGAHPPIPVAPAFESVIASFEERETAILQANAYENRVLPMAEAEGTEMTWRAQADRTRRMDIAAAEVDLFRTRLQIHRDLPRIFTSRLYLETLDRALQPVHKHVVATSPDLEVLIFNLEDKLSPDLFDFGPDLLEDRFL